MPISLVKKPLAVYLGSVEKKFDTGQSLGSFPTLLTTGDQI
jgi:hypothetical protein